MLSLTANQSAPTAADAAFVPEAARSLPPAFALQAAFARAIAMLADGGTDPMRREASQYGEAMLAWALAAHHAARAAFPDALDWCLGRCAERLARPDAPGYHGEFLAWALLHAARVMPELRDPVHRMLRAAPRLLRRSPVANWYVLGTVASLHAAEQGTTLPVAPRAGAVGLLRRIARPSGFLEDRALVHGALPWPRPRSASRSTQYHAFLTALALDAATVSPEREYRSAGQRGARVLTGIAAADGMVLPLGRGAGQLFGVAAAVLVDGFVQHGRLTIPNWAPGRLTRAVATRLAADPTSVGMLWSVPETVAPTLPFLPDGTVRAGWYQYNRLADYYPFLLAAVCASSRPGLGHTPPGLAGGRHGLV